MFRVICGKNESLNSLIHRDYLLNAEGMTFMNHIPAAICKTISNAAADNIVIFIMILIESGVSVKYL